MSASPRFSQFDVYYIFIFITCGTDGRKERGTRARVAENDTSAFSALTQSRAPDESLPVYNND